MSADFTPSIAVPDTTALVRPRWRTIALRLAVSLLITAGFVWLMQRGGLPMLPPSAAWDRLAWWATPAFLVLCCITVALRTYRWLHLLRPIQPKLSARFAWGVGLVGLAATVLAPLRMGEMARPWLISRRGDIRFLQATGAVAGERIVDGLLLMSLLAAGLALATPLSPLPDRIGDLQVPVALVPVIASSALLTFVLAFTLMAAFYFFHDLVTRIVRGCLALVSAKLADWTIAQLERVSEGLAFLPSRKHRNAFLRDSALYWALAAVSYWVLLRGTGAQADLAQAAVIMGVMGLGTLLPSGPGFFGTYQLGAYCGLAMFFPESVVVQAGAVFTFVSYTCQLAVTLLFGLVGLKLMASAAPRV